MNEFEFEGKNIKPWKDGKYRCPFKCHTDSRYPTPKWKTEKGIKRHLENCLYTPSALKEAEKRRQEEMKTKEEKKKKALEECTYKVGDEIFYVYEVIIKDTHEWRGNRRVKVRYEAVKSFGASKTTIKTIEYNGYSSVYFNGNIYPRDIYKTMEEAEMVAKEKQKSYDEACKFASFCR